MTTALPSTVTYGTVTGKLVQAVADTVADVDLLPDAVPAQGTVTFTPAPSAILAATATPPTTILPAPITVALQPDGSFSVTLIATDDPQLNPSFWTYSVTFDIVGVRYGAFPIEVPGGQTVDITKAAQIPSSAGTPVTKGDPGPAGSPGINTPPPGTPRHWVGVSDGNSPEGVTWLDPVTLGLAGSGVTTNSGAGTFTVTQGQYAATGYTTTKTDQLLTLKANATDVATALDGKVDAGELAADLTGKVDAAVVGAPGGVAPLGDDGKIGSQFLPAAAPGSGGSSGLTYAGVITGTYSGDYAAQPGTLIHVDNRIGSDVIDLPATGRIAVHAVGVTAPNTTKINAPVGKTFDNGEASLEIDGDPVIGYEFEQVSDTLIAIRVIANDPVVLRAAADAAQAAQSDADALDARVTVLERQSGTGSGTAAPLQLFTLRAHGPATVGEIDPPGHFVEYGPATGSFAAVRVRARTAPATGPCTVQVLVDGTVAYTIILPQNASSFNDTAANIPVVDGQDVTLNCTATGGAADLEFIFAEQPGSYLPAPPTIGTVVVDTDTAQSGAFSVSFLYQSKDEITDDLAAFQVVYRKGSTPPASLTNGTAGPLIAPDGTVNEYTAQVSGLPNLTTYSYAVFPVAKTPGLVGVAGTGTVTTTARDTTPPGPGTAALQAGTKNQNGGVVVLTPDPASPDFDGYWLREAYSATPPATVTSNRPANSGHSGSGSGLWVPGNGDLSPIYVAITDADPGANIAVSAFAQDTSGLVQTVPASTHWFTSTAATSGQGAYGLVPASHVPNYSQDASGTTPLADFARDNGWAHQTQGPSDQDNWSVITDPSDSTNKVIRMTGKYVANGPYNNTRKDFNSTFTGGILNGSGRYGARGNLLGAAHIYTYGAWEIKVRTFGPFINGWKGGTVMLWPWVPKGTPSPWPAWELDVLEIYRALERQINIHLDNGTKNGTQLQTSDTFDLTQWTTITVLVERANAATGDPVRLRIWFNGVLKFDTGLPSANIGPTPAGLSAAKIATFVRQPQKLQLGFSLAYTQYATYGFGSNPGTQNFDIDSINMWTAPAAA